MPLNKFTKTALIVGLYYVVPLLWNPMRIFHLQILVLMLACAALLLTQPEIKFGDAAENRDTDRNSWYALLLAGSASQIIAVVEWGYFRDPTLTPVAKWLLIDVGFLLIVGGLLVRVWSINILGHAFTAAVEEVEDHELITSGPYAYVRHPSYLGAYAAVLGSAVFLTTILGTLFAAVAMFYAYRMRIAVEEQFLQEKFGDQFREYQLRVPYRMIPRVW